VVRASMARMSEHAGTGLDEALTKMRSVGVAPPAVDVFARYWQQLCEGVTGTIGEDEIDPVETLDALEDLDPDADTEALAHTAVVKLNGGLGTSMGMDRAKSLLPVREDQSFLDLIARQVRHARKVTGARLPLVLMHSFSTRDDCLEALGAHPDLPVDGIPPDFLQSQEPKLRADDLRPVEWPPDPSLEWCPPGHGDLYVSLLTSGVLDDLVDAGFRYAFVSNSDNVGASPSAAVAAWFAGSGAPMALEVCRRTAADRKGGHLAVRRSDRRLVLREKAQVAEQDSAAFADVGRHRYFNTNNLWLDLQQVRDALAARDGVLGLPMIRNDKTVDPTDPASTPVVQIESAMGAAIEVFDDATAIEVPRSRFRPVKTTEDLLLLRSDAFELSEDGTLDPVVDPLPLVTLGDDYAAIRDFEQRFPHGAPSLRQAASLTVEGDWTFGQGVQVRGEVHLADTGRAERIDDGDVLQGHRGADG
jgi:UTP--glucose-1-phosphate uridylyltransferase